jgi:hypothetical protein
VHTRAVTADQMAPAGRENMKPVNDTIERDGVRIPTGPPLAEVERVTGFPITRARLDDAVPLGTPLDAAKRTNQASTGAPRDGEAGGSNAGVRVEAIRRAAMEAARAAEQATAQPAHAPAHITVVRPFGVPGAKPAAPARPATSAPRDSSAH